MNLLLTPNTVHTISAPLNCDCVEVLSDDTILVGMYAYDEASRQRGGGMLLVNESGQIRLSETNELFGILDAKKYSRRPSTALLACSDGCLRLYDSVSHKDLVERSLANTAGGSATTDNILMAIDHNENISTCSITAKGVLTLLDQELNAIMNVQAHDPTIESWTCAISPPQSCLIATGADDCCLKLWETRTKELVAQNKKSHRTGVTTLAFINEHEILTGSYDERIRRFDTRNLIHPVTEEKSIGGVWRLKPMGDLLFVAACYGGCQIVRLDDFKPVSSPYTEHASMAYGIAPLNEHLAISCSFYDTVVKIWQI